MPTPSFGSQVTLVSCCLSSLLREASTSRPHILSSGLHVPQSEGGTGSLMSCLLVTDCDLRTPLLYSLKNNARKKQRALGPAAVAVGNMPLLTTLQLSIIISLSLSLMEAAALLQTLQPHIHLPPLQPVPADTVGETTIFSSEE